jgi:hypothetical protein
MVLKIAPQAVAVFKIILLLDWNPGGCLLQQKLPVDFASVFDESKIGTKQRPLH